MTPPTDCARFRARLDDHVTGEASDAERLFAASHLATCTACRHVLADAADTEAALRAWEVPGPPPSLRERILRSVRAERFPERIACADLRAELAAWTAGDTDEDRARFLAAHASTCEECAEEARAARAVDGALAAWAVPGPPAGLKERVLDVHVRADRARRLAGIPRANLPGEFAFDAVPNAGGSSSPRPRLALRRIAVWAAAAALLLAAVLVRPGGPPESNSTSGPNRVAGAPPVQDLLQRYADVRVRAVADHQFPASVGRFSARPALADRLRRTSGNAFHRSLRKVLASPAEDGR